MKRYGGPPITINWFGGGGIPYTVPTTGQIKIPITEFYKDQDALSIDFVHEQAHYFKTLVRGPDGKFTGELKVENGQLFGGHGTIGYFDAIRQAGRYHIGLSAWMIDFDAKYAKASWDAFGWSKWFDLLPLRY